MAAVSDCAGIAASYVCGNHDNVPTYSGEIIPAKAGDELAMNSLIISVVDIDGSGNGSGLIKMPMMNNIKLGLTLTGIKVAKGGCIVAGSAELSGVSASILNEQQRANLQKAYAAYNQVLDVAAENAGAIAETYNNFSQMLNGMQQKAAALAAKIGNGGKPTKAEVEALKSLTAQTTANMQASLDVIKKQMGEQVNAEAAAKLQAMIDQNKANAAALTAPASGQPTPAALAAAASSLAATQPAQVEKQIKELPPLAVEYNGKVYAKNGTTIKVISTSKQLAIKNLVENESLTWAINSGVSGQNNPVEINFPEGKKELTLDIVQGNRKLNVIVQQLPDLVLNHLTLIDNDSPKRTATENQTLYLIPAPHYPDIPFGKGVAFNRVKSMIGTTPSKTQPFHFKSNEPIWKLTYSGQNEVLDKFVGQSSFQIPLRGSVSSYTYSVDVNGVNKKATVEMIEYYKHEAEVAPPAVKATLYGIKEGLKTIEKVAEKLQGVNFPQIKADVIFNQQEYNEEDKDSRFYFIAQEWEGKVVLERLNWEQKIIGIPLPQAVTKYIDFGIYAAVKGEVEFIYSSKKGRLNNQTTFKQLEKDGKVQGVLGVGGRVTAKVKEGNLFTAEANGNLKSEIELMGGLRKDVQKNEYYLVAGGVFKPIVFSIDIKVAVSKTDWSPEIEMLNVNYVKNLTNEVELFKYPPDDK